MPVPLTHDALEAAYARFGPLIRRRCQNIMRDQQLAEDACQNVFLKLLRDGEGFRQADSKIAWLYRVGDNCCFDLLRARKTKRLVALEALPDDGADDPEHARIFERERAMKLLAKLDDELRRVAIMHYLDELSQGQISEALGVSRQTVNAKVAKLRARLLEGE